MIAAKSTAEAKARHILNWFRNKSSRALYDAQFSCSLETLVSVSKTHTPVLSALNFFGNFSRFENPLPRTESPGLHPSAVAPKPIQDDLGHVRAWAHSFLRGMCGRFYGQVDRVPGNSAHQ
jgi:hypothetical protein